MASYDNSGDMHLTPESMRVLEEVLKRYRLNARPTTASDILSGAGAVTGAMADTMAANRSAGVQAAVDAETLNQSRQRDYFAHSVARERDRRESGTDAWRKLQQSEHVATNAGYKPKAGLPSHGFGPKASTATERAAAANVRDEAERRLNARDSLLPTVVDPGRFQFDPKLMRASGGERAADVGGFIASLLSWFR